LSTLQLPVLHASPFALLRSGIRWLRRDGETVSAREPIAHVGLALRAPRGSDALQPFPEEQVDLQVALAPSVGGILRPNARLSQGGFQDLVGSQPWDAGSTVGALEAAEKAELVPLLLAGRRGFDAGEGRGELLSGWHDRARAFWEGSGEEGPAGTVLSLGICEQTGVFRGEGFAFQEWFARAPGPAQIISIADERTVHSSAVLLQHLQRTPAEANAIAETVHSWIGERIAGASYPAFLADAQRGIRRGRWPDGQSLLFALHLLAEAVGASPLLERTDLLTRRGLVDQGPPEVVVLSLGSEFAPHFRHRATGWLVGMHDFRLRGFIGPAVRDWLKRDFEPVRRTVADAERDLGALSAELSARTGGVFIIQNAIATSPGDRIPNYSWLGDGFADCVPVACAEANLMLGALTRVHDVSVLDADALAADHGVRHCADRAHPGRVLLDALREETHRILRERKIHGF
jgi:hypothetical protein